MARFAGGCRWLDLQVAVLVGRALIKLDAHLSKVKTVTDRYPAPCWTASFTLACVSASPIWADESSILKSP